MRSLTLLIQLFGRDVMDRLAAAGFESGRAIVRAGAERLAEEGGVDLSLARRIVAVATESEASAEEDASAEAALDPEAPARAAGRAPAAAGGRASGARRNAAPERQSPAERQPGSERPAEGGGHVRRPLRRPSSPLAVGRPAPAVASPDEIDAALLEAAGIAPEETLTAAADDAAGAVAPVPVVAPEEPAGEPQAAARPLDAEPFVDDVGLIAWMGLNPSGRPPGAASFGVADGILDTPRRRPDRPSPILEEAPVLQAPIAPPAAPDPASAPATPASAPAIPAPAPAIPAPALVAPAPAPAAAASAAARRQVAVPGRPATVVAGSFWSFGRIGSPPAPPAGARGMHAGPAASGAPGHGDREAKNPAAPVAARPVLPRRRAHDD